MSTILATNSPTRDPHSDIPKYRRRAIVEGARVFQQAISEATGQSAVERRQSIDRVCDRFRAEHYKLVRVDGRAVA